MKAGVKTAEDALLYIKKKDSAKKGRTVSEPEWMKQEEAETKQEENKGDSKRAQELIDELFGDDDE